MLRVSLGNFLFFTILAVFMMGIKNQKDPRDSVHHGGWMIKIICWCLLVILMFFVPNEIISFYGKPYLFEVFPWLWIVLVLKVSLYVVLIDLGQMLHVMDYPLLEKW